MSAVQVHRPLAQGDKAFSRQHQKRIKNWAQSHARVSGKDEVPAGTYDRDCQALYERISGVA